MMPILGKPMVERMVERVAAARSVERIVIATSDRAEDDALADLAQRIGVGCFRGSPHDVLARVAAAARACRADPVIELLGDNPLVHAELIDAVVERFQTGGFDYAASVTTEYPMAGPSVKKFPVGIRVQVVSAEALSRCDRMAQTPESREHSTLYVAQHPERFRVGYVEAAGGWAGLNRPELTFAVNYQENFELVSRIFERCYPQDPQFTLEAALAAFNAEPGLAPLMEVPAGVRHAPA